MPGPVPVTGDPLIPQQSAEYVIVKHSGINPVLVGTTAQIVLNESTVRTTPFGKETVEKYEIANGQDAFARAFMDDCLNVELCIDAERRRVKGDNTTIEVTWAYDREDSLWVPGNDAYLWDFEIIDTSQPLMSHPYFGRNSALSEADQDALMREMGACDQAISLGKDYTLQDATASALVQTIMARYAGLRFSGVDEWNPIMVMLSVRYRIFPSQAADGVWSGLFYGIHRSGTLIAEESDIPDHIIDAIEGIKNWDYQSSGSPDPQESQTPFVWVRQKPQVKLSGRNANGPCDVTDYYLGMQKASQVLFPAADGGGWDPQYDIGA
jgi:hypothetical protein